MQHSPAIIGRKPLPAAYEQEVQGVLSVSSLQDRVVRAMLSIVPSDGSTIGNTALRRELEKQLQAEGLAIGDDDYWQAHSALVADGALVKGQGRGGSVRLAQMGGKVEASSSSDLADDAGGFALQAQQAPELRSAPTPPKAPAAATRPTAAVTRSAAGEAAQIISYRHADKRKNNPEVGMVTPATDPEAGKTRWAYDPHLDPALQFDPARQHREADRRRAGIGRHRPHARGLGRAQAPAVTLPELGRQGRAHQLRDRHRQPARP